MTIKLFQGPQRAHMNALTVWQPWATLIALGLKPWEFRGWPAPRRHVGQRIAIHAAARHVNMQEVYALTLQLDRGEKGAALRAEALPFLRQVLDGATTLPLRHIVCTARLGTPIRATELPPEWADRDRANPAMWAWPMEAVEPMVPPEPATGAQGFWKWGGR